MEKQGAVKKLSFQSDTQEAAILCQPGAAEALEDGFRPWQPSLLLKNGCILLGAGSRSSRKHCETINARAGGGRVEFSRAHEQNRAARLLSCEEI